MLTVMSGHVSLFITLGSPKAWACQMVKVQRGSGPVLSSLLKLSICLQYVMLLVYVLG